MEIYIEKKLYQCNYCDKAFLNTYDLKIHMNLHSDEKPYHCYSCNKVFSKNLTQHSVLHKFTSVHYIF